MALVWGTAQPQRGHEPGPAHFPPRSCSTGYINHSLSVFRVQDFEPHTKAPKTLPGFDRGEIRECRYRQHPPP